MADLKDIFADIDANQDTRSTADLNEIINDTVDFSPDTPESYGLQFIPEGDERQNDKINYNFRHLAAEYVVVDDDYIASPRDFIYADTTNLIAQVDIIDTFTTAHGTDYITTINSTPLTYTSDALVAQEDTVDTITVADSTTYTLTVNGTEATYTSGVGATSAEITLGLVTAINLIAEAVTATDGVDQFTILADVAGTSFATVITAGIMTVTTTTPNSFATEAEIIAGIVNAINTGAEPVTAANLTTYITITADVSGIAFTSSINANMVITNSVPNKIGEIIIDLPTEQNRILNILDVKNNFATANATINPGTNTINSSAGNVNLSVNNSLTTLILVGTDWRYLS